MRILINGIIAILGLLYPLAVYFGLQYFEPWKLAGALLVLLLIKLGVNYSNKHWSQSLLIAGILYCGFAIWSNNQLSLRFYPVLVNGVLLAIFSLSLRSSSSLIERLARLQYPNLSPEGIIYTRQVTQIWCGFFVFNGFIALLTAIWGSFEVWSLYNGLVAYILMGILMGGEYIIRKRIQTHV
ncbi:MAG: hypothetical protein NTV43_02425 [Methylococcales bacterium]|nr:hypothetical protein [Methylococcales bacterium]